MVVICDNPHEKGTEHIVGMVRSVRAAQGLCGTDLVYVRYTSPTDGKADTMPFARRCLSRAEPSALLRLARQLEARAAQLRALAERLGSQR
jgi:hypothetical protein